MIPDRHLAPEEFEGLSLGDQPPPAEQYGLYGGEPVPPPPAISSDGIVAFDVTSRFRNAAKTLEPGELIKDGYFSLMDSVASIEIMDPKMDSGCLGPGETLEEEYDVTKPLRSEQVIGIIDQLLCHEMAWHLGYPLSQTLFTNVYIEGILMPTPRTIEQADFIRDQAQRDPMLAVLRAYCLGLLKACYHVNERIKGEHYYEEEDFVTNTYHRSLLDSIDEAAIRQVITEARTSLRSGTCTETPLADALESRLQLREEFLNVIQLSEDRNNSADSIKAPWIELEQILEAIRKSHALGTAVPEAFSTKIQRKLASTMPPRPIVQLSFEDTYSHFKHMFADGREVTDVLAYTDSQSLLNFVLHFQAKRPQPLVYIRTLLQSYLFKDMIILGKLSIRHIMDDDLSTLVLPASPLLDPTNDAFESAPHSPQFQLANRMELFRQRAAQSYLDVFRAICQNRCRIRRTLCHAIQDWENVQLDAEEVDQVLALETDEPAMSWPRPTSPPSHSLSLSSWAYLYKLKLMEWVVQLGFELDIYAPDELAGMYWYLSLLARTRSQHVQRIQAFAERNVREVARTRKLNDEEEMQFDRAANYWQGSLLDAAVTCQLADALSSIYIVLGRLRLVTPPPRPYSTDEMRYNVRMKPFGVIGLSELPDYETFKEAALQPKLSAAQLLDAATSALEGAKRGFKAMERFDEDESFARGLTFERFKAGLAGSHKSAIAAGLTIMMLRKAVGEKESRKTKTGESDEKELGLKVEIKAPNQRYHEWWVVPGLVKAPNKSSGASTGK